MTSFFTKSVVLCKSQRMRATKKLSFLCFFAEIYKSSNAKKYHAGRKGMQQACNGITWSLVKNSKR